ncbi:MAG: single-stranded-DNA-specific exonuclease RecJ [Christensenellales bacterium]
MNVDVVVKNEYPVDPDKVRSIADKLGLNEKFVELLFRRGVASEEDIKRFLYPDESMFYDPFLLKGMNEAVARLDAAIQNQEKIVVYGDYDADGVCAAAILSLFLSKKGLNVLVHIPNRIGEGYGLNVDSLGRIIESELPDLILTCDCGISGADEVKFATELGVDVIVTDHHEISGEIPDCTVVNPKQPDCNYPYDMLCGAGVALKLVEAMSDRKTMLEYADLACVATIADLVPLMDENRLIVQYGLKSLNECKNVGLKVMFDALKLGKITSGDVAFKVAPRINAAGRMGDAYRAFEL